VVVGPFNVDENNGAPVEFDERITVVAVVVGFPNWSCSCTVIGPRFAVVDAAPVTAALVTASLDGAPGLIVACCVADVTPAVDAVIVGEPATVSP
jgi:hypothetical protein